MLALIGSLASYRFCVLSLHREVGSAHGKCKTVNMVKIVVLRAVLQSLPWPLPLLNIRSLISNCTLTLLRIKSHPQKLCGQYMMMLMTINKYKDGVYQLNFLPLVSQAPKILSKWLILCVRYPHSHSTSVVYQSSKA